MPSAENDEKSGQTRRDALRGLGAVAVGAAGTTVTANRADAETATAGQETRPGATLRTPLIAGDGGPGDAFGLRTVTDGTGDTVAVAAPAHDTATGIDVGSVYVYRRAGAARTATDVTTERDPDLDDTVRVTDGGTVFVGQTAVVDGGVSEGDVVNLLAPGESGALLAQRVVEGGSAAFDTASIDDVQPAPGYRLTTGGEVLATFQFVEQDYAVTAEDGTVDNAGEDTTLELTVTSNNRFGYTHVVSADRLSGSELQSVLGTGQVADVDDDGEREVYITDGTTEDTLTANFADVAVGEYTLEFEVFDTTAADSVTVEVEQGAGYYQEVKLQPTDATGEDGFGNGLALSADGTTLAAGAVTHETAAGETGAVYVYDYPWDRTAKLVPTDGDPDDRFGFSVALSSDGTTALVGAFNDADPNGDGDESLSGGGSAYVFERDDDTWRQRAKLAADDGGPDSWFGYDVALSADGTTALVGAPRTDTDDGQRAGSAYLFETTATGTEWTQVERLRVPDGTAQDVFGTAVGLSADATAAFGGAYQRGNGGTVESFRRDGEWDHAASFTSEAVDGGDEFGWSLDVSSDGERVLVGAVGDGAADGADAGRAYLFGLTDDGWVQEESLATADRQSGDRFGEAAGLTADGTVGVVGVSGDDNGQGSGAGLALVYEFAGGFADRFDDGDGEVDPGEVLAMIEAYNGDGEAVSAQDVLAAIEAYNNDAGWDAVGD